MAATMGDFKQLIIEFCKIA